MIEHGLNSNKFIYIPNGFDKEEFEKLQEEVPTEHFKLITKLKKEQKFLVGYAGGHGPSNAMQVFVHVAEMMKDNAEIAFISVGSGPSKSDLKTKAQNLSNIYFLPPVPKQAIQKLLSLFDILYVGFVKSEIHIHGISPNKLIDYMLAAKPIILSADVGYNIVDEANCGIVVPAEDSSATLNAIIKIMKMSKTERIEMGERGRILAASEFDYHFLSLKFLESIF
jgi:glycosyltransferase involved in cell wall biosynthesis